VLVCPEQHVSWLDVPVHDSRFVGRGQCGGDLLTNPGRLLRRQRPVLGEHRGEAARRQVLHHQPGNQLAAGVGARVESHVVDADSVRVLQPSCDAALAHRPIRGRLCLRLCQAGRDQQLLERYRAVEPFVVRSPDRAHRTSGDALLQTVATGDEPVIGVHLRRSSLTISG
jgi:hypothetical protein